MRTNELVRDQATQKQVNYDTIQTSGPTQLNQVFSLRYYNFQNNYWKPQKVQITLDQQ